MDTGKLSHLKSVGVRFINDGEEENLECSRSGPFFLHFSEARCTRGKVKLFECKYNLKLVTYSMPLKYF